MFLFISRKEFVKEKLSNGARTCLCTVAEGKNICVVIHSVSNRLMSYEYGKNVTLEKRQRNCFAYFEFNDETYSTYKGRRKGMHIKFLVRKSH
jgi:hypothetical protein